MQQTAAAAAIGRCCMWGVCRCKEVREGFAAPFMNSFAIKKIKTTKIFKQI